MNWTMAIIAFLSLAGFIGILIVKVPSPDLIGVAILTLALVAYDLVTSAGRKD